MLSYDELVKLARFCANQARTAQRTERIRQRPTRFKENKNALMRLPKNSGCGKSMRAFCRASVSSCQQSVAPFW
jgi:hypothetical protein